MRPGVEAEEHQHRRRFDQVLVDEKVGALRARLGHARGGDRGKVEEREQASAPRQPARVKRPSIRERPTSTSAIGIDESTTRKQGETARPWKRPARGPLARRADSPPPTTASSGAPARLQAGAQSL